MFHELQPGGARRVVNELAVQLKKKNTVDLFTLSSQFFPSEYKFYTHVRLFQFSPSFPTIHDWKKRMYRDSIELYRLSRVHKKIAEEIDIGDYHVLLSFSSLFTHAPFLFRYTKTPLIYYCHEPLRLIYDKSLPFPDVHGVKKYYEKFSRRVRKQIDLSNVRFADTIFTSSQFTKKNIELAYRRSSIVVPPGVDTRFFHNKKSLRDIDVLFIGSFDYVDGYDRWKKIRSKLKNSIKVEERDSKKFQLTDDEVRNLYQRAKIVLCLSRNEPFGLVPLEAMSCGAIVLAVNEGGYRETILSGKTGMLLEPKNHNFVKSIRYLLSKPDILLKMSSDARIHARTRWNWASRAYNLENALNDELRLR